jgi:ABC-type sugar transport system ATPase subunit
VSAGSNVAISPASTPLVLEARGVSKRFAGIAALLNVDIALHKGRCRALVGENGAGKSTLIKIISGQLEPDSGTINVAGEDVVMKSPSDALRLGISVVPQELSLIPEISVAENVMLGRFPRRSVVVDFKELFARAREILQRLGLEVSPNTRLGDLSPGAQQLVEIARGLCKDARIFILDEPTAALTESESENLFKVLGELKRSGFAILYVSHRMRDLARVAEDITVLRDGVVVKEWEGESVDEDTIVQAMVGRPVQRFFNTLRHDHLGKSEALRVENLSRSGVLHDVSFTVHSGEVLALTGLMGAGRTEVLRALFGADPIDSGRIVVGGKETTIRSPRDAIRAGMALVPEERKAQGIVENMSILDNISLPHLSHWALVNFIAEYRRRADANEIARKMTVKSEAFANPVRSLSGGNQQKVVIGKWLIGKPLVFLLDEPTRGIDVGAKFEIYKLINELASEGTAVLLVSSELPEVLGLADRILVLRHGEIVGELRSEGATEEAIIELAMFGRRTESNEWMAGLAAPSPNQNVAVERRPI